MKKNNTVLIVIISLILFLPSSSVNSATVKTWLETTDRYELLSNEGFVAFECNEVKVVDKEVVVNKCECKGTGKITTGDNRVLNCPCENCTCGKKNTDTEKKNTDTVPDKESVEEIDYIQSLEARCILFTNPEWCTPCVQLENSTLKELKQARYKFGNIDKKFVHISILDETSPLFAKYGHGTIPLFLFVKNGKVVKELTGYQTSKVISEAINKNLTDE